MSEVKRPRGRSTARVLPMPGTVENTEGCPGCRGDGYYHHAQCKRRTADRAAVASHGRGGNKRRAADSAASASHVGGAASRVGRCISIQTTSQAAGGAAISSQGWRCLKSNSSCDSHKASRPRRARQQFMWELPTKKHSFESSSSGSCE